MTIVNTFAHVDLQVKRRSLREWRSEVIPSLRQLLGVGVRLVRECTRAPASSTSWLRLLLASP